MKKVFLSVIFMIIALALLPLTLFAQETEMTVVEEDNESMDGLSVGLLIGLNPSMFDIGGFFMDQTDGLWNLVNGQSNVETYVLEGGSYIPEGAHWNGGVMIDSSTDDDPYVDANRYGTMIEEGSGPMGFNLALDIKYRFLSFLFARVAVRYCPVITGGSFEAKYYLSNELAADPNTATLNADPVRVSSSFSGYNLVVPIQVGLYVPTGIGGGVYFGFGPSIFSGGFEWEMKFNGTNEQMQQILGVDTSQPFSKSGTLSMNDYGVGMSFCLGWEQEIFDSGVMLFFNITVDQYYPHSVQEEVNGISMENPAGPTAVTGIMIKEFNRRSNRFSYWETPGKEDQGSITYQWSPNFSGWQFMLGVEYRIPGTAF